MKNAKRLMVLALALALCLTALVMPTASADTGIKAKFGAFAAETSDKLFMILPGEGVSSLYSMPAAGGYLTLIETASQISDLVADASGNVYYLRYTGASFQAIMRKTDGERAIVAEFGAGSIAHSLCLYNGKLYCLVNSRLMEIDLTARSATQLSERGMTAYTIADGIVYYESADDVANYQMASALTAGATVNGSSGRLYGMMLDGSNDMLQFDQGVSALYAYDEYVYFHNLNDSYIVSSDTQEWLDGCLYRLNVNTAQYIKVLSQYDWSYRPTDYGLVIYREKALLQADLSGQNEVLVYEPDPYNYMAILDDSVIIFEYNLAQPKLSRVNLKDSQTTLLWEGAFVSYNSTGEEVVSTPTAAPGEVESNDAQTTGGNQTGINYPLPGTSTGTATGTGTAGQSATGYTAAGSMTIGATGDEVRKLQNRLIELGYLSGSADGIYGQKTANAVKSFQRAAGLTADGIAGNATINAINRDSAPRASRGSDSSYIFPNSSSVRLTRNDVLSIDRSLWPYARNEIYARHGYIFDTKAYADYFAKKSWYRPGGFKTSDLNAIEWDNMELIRAMEKEFANVTPTTAPTAIPSGGSSSGSTAGLPYAAQLIGANEYILPYSNVTKLSKSDILAIDRTLWPYARNEILARHGYKFSKDTYSNYFNSRTWYTPGGYSSSSLNSTEWYNIDLIKWMEDNA